MLGPLVPGLVAGRFAQSPGMQQVALSIIAAVVTLGTLWLRRSPPGEPQVLEVPGVDLGEQLVPRVDDQAGCGGTS